MDWTETELGALRRAYASGTTRVSYDGKSVDYDSVEDRFMAEDRICLNCNTHRGLEGSRSRFRLLC
jgi:hypothetical protein